MHTPDTGDGGRMESVLRPDIILRGGRVMDPETQRDEVIDVAIRDCTIIGIGPGPYEGGIIIDVRGLVVAPGFIDMHSHAHTRAGLRLQAFDGVTTALELELGASPVAPAYERLDRAGSPINYGFAASWADARVAIVDGNLSSMPLAISRAMVRSGRGDWGRPQSDATVGEVLRALEQDFSDGAIGIGISLGYAPETDPSEYLALATLASRLDVPTFTHSRSLALEGPGGTTLEATREIIKAGADTGAHMHMCHINSSTHRMGDAIQEIWADAVARGGRLTVEGYPYGSGSTAVGAHFLSPDGLRRMGLTPSSLKHVASGRRLSDRDELVALRREDPGALVIVDFLDENDPAQREILFGLLSNLDAAIASDAIAPDVMDPGSGDAIWPPHPSHSHPRGAGCYSRTLRWLVRENGVLSLMDALRKSSLLPAQILADAVPSMARKGRLQVGCDADIVVFDAEKIRDVADYDNGAQPSVGVRELLVGGRCVISGGELQENILPGRGVYGRYHA